MMKKQSKSVDHNKVERIEANSGDDHRRINAIENTMTLSDITHELEKIDERRSDLIAAVACRRISGRRLTDGSFELRASRGLERCRRGATHTATCDHRMPPPCKSL